MVGVGDWGAQKLLAQLDSIDAPCWSLTMPHLQAPRHALATMAMKPSFAGPKICSLRFNP
jgi:hypothetical protein